MSLKRRTGRYRCRCRVRGKSCHWAEHKRPNSISSESFLQGSPLPCGFGVTPDGAPSTVLGSQGLPCGLCGLGLLQKVEQILSLAGSHGAGSQPILGHHRDLSPALGSCTCYAQVVTEGKAWTGDSWPLAPFVLPVGS